MNKLEYHILKIFQDMVLKEYSDPRYTTLDDELICIIKGPEEKDLYIKTEAPLEGRVLNMLQFSKIDNNLYKVIWSPKFLYLIGDKNQDITVSKELELLSLSTNPLSNYIKTLT